MALADIAPRTRAAARLAALEPDAGPLSPERLARIVAALAADRALWRPAVRHDPLSRWYARLHADDAVETWLIGWEVGQDTRLHDHGGARGAFAVCQGRLTEDYTPAGGPVLRRRVHDTGARQAFGAAYVHNLCNEGPAPATSVHAYSPPLRTMRFHDLVDGRLVPTGSVWVAGPEPGGAAPPLNVEDLLAGARSRLRRLGPHEAAAVVARGGLLVDIRPAAQRRREGEVPGAVVIERNVLEWRLDPASDARLPEAGYDTQVVVMCSEGYTSSLAAAALQDLGVRRATDLRGGFAAWAAAGLPTRPAA
jgi:rhodanese-related sulfurtransferase